MALRALGPHEPEHRHGDPVASLSQARSDRVVPKDRRGIGSFGDGVIPGKQITVIFPGAKNQSSREVPMTGSADLWIVGAFWFHYWQQFWLQFWASSLAASRAAHLGAHLGAKAGREAGRPQLYIVRNREPT